MREAETLSQFLLAQLRAESDLATAEGRARFVSMAKPHGQKITAPALRLQLINEIGQLGRVAEGDIERLLELPQRPRFQRPAPARRSFDAPASLEWSLLTALLTDLTLVEHIDTQGTVSAAAGRASIINAITCITKPRFMVRFKPMRAPR